MSNRIPSTPLRSSQSETDTDTSSLVSSPSSSEQISASEEDSENSAQAPVMKTRQTRDVAPTTPATHNTNSSAPPQATMTSSSPTVKNRTTGDQKRARYGQSHNLPAYQRDTNIKKVKIEEQGGPADIQHEPEHNAVFKEFSSAVRDGRLYSNSVRLKNFMGDLAAWLPTSPDCLRELFLLVVEENSADFAVLAEALGNNTTLINLKVIGYLGKEGAAAIADALRVNTTLTELNLLGNDIGDEGAKALADALKVNTTVTKLDFGSNDIGAEGAKAMVEVLQFNKTLTRLSFECTDEIDIEKNKLLERNRRLKLQLYAEASFDLIFKHSPVLREAGLPKELISVFAQQLPGQVLATFEQEWGDAFRAPPPPVTTTTTNATVTTTTTTTTDSTIPTTLITSPPALAADPASTPPSMPAPTATADDIKALLADPNPVIALSRWIDGHTNQTTGLNWVDPANGYTLLHYAVEAQQGAVIKNLMARGIDLTKGDQNNQTAAELARRRADSSSSTVAAAIAALFQ